MPLNPGDPGGTQNPPLPGVPSYVPQKYAAFVADAAGALGIPPSVVAAQVKDESDFDPNAVSPTGAQGIVQFEPGTWATYGQGSPFNVSDAFAAYIAYMRVLIKQEGGSVRNALAAYNAGPGNLSAGYGYADTILGNAGQPGDLKAGKGGPGLSPSTDTSTPTTEPGGGSLDVTAPLRAAGAFLHDVSVPIAWGLEVFEPGQGVRLVAGVGAIAAGAGGVKAWHSAAQNPEGTALPVAIALFGVAAAGAFIAIRPWPQPGGKPVKTWAYVASVVKGQPPAAGPAARPPVGAVEAGLVTLFGLWAASKAAEGIAGAVTAGAGIGAAFGKLWSKIKPIAADVGKAGEVAGEAAA